MVVTLQLPAVRKLLNVRVHPVSPSGHVVNHQVLKDRLGTIVRAKERCVFPRFCVEATTQWV